VAAGHGALQKCLEEALGFLENHDKLFITVKNILKIFWKTLGKGFSPKTLFGFQENHYSYFLLCEPLWVF
jgi:hypothetical protein